VLRRPRGDLVDLVLGAQLQEDRATRHQVRVGHAQAQAGQVQPVVAAVDRQQGVFGEAAGLGPAHPRRVGGDECERLLRRQHPVHRPLAHVHVESGALGVVPGEGTGDRVDVDRDEWTAREGGGQEPDVAGTRTQLQNPSRGQAGQQLGAPPRLLRRPRPRLEHALVVGDVQGVELQVAGAVDGTF
jgi:hypothetical protein